MMKTILAAIILLASSCCAQGVGGSAGIGGKAGMGGGAAASIAIAFDAASGENAASATTTLTYAMTVGTITNGLLLVGMECSSATTAPTSVTYNGSAMTLLTSTTWFFAGGKVYLYALLAPSGGAHNVVITFAGAQTFKSSAASYSGVFQSLTPDATATPTSGSASSTTLTLTTVANNSWTFAFCVDTVVSAGAGATLRTTGASPSSGMFDSNGPKTPAGSTSETINFSTSGQFGAVMVSFTHA